ncbi:hypothetical protein BB8028_0004g04350 [Beauveria bassiana]|uniref:Uncharacterized protein n=1 Tax=Beauveria bassiana TaxID=176275 RepID=A0A2S7YBW0_BEABA|nr:hypothetical protein BB8028_0004g04350 [Beauveria bassiana]
MASYGRTQRACTTGDSRGEGGGLLFVTYPYICSRGHEATTYASTHSVGGPRCGRSRKDEKEKKNKNKKWANGRHASQKNKIKGFNKRLTESQQRQSQQILTKRITLVRAYCNTRQPGWDPQLPIGHLFCSFRASRDGHANPPTQTPLLLPPDWTLPNPLACSLFVALHRID